MKTYYFTLSYGVHVEAESEEAAAEMAVWALGDGNAEWEDIQLTDVYDDEEDVDIGGEG